MNWLSCEVPAQWHDLLGSVFADRRWPQLADFLSAELESGKTIYPPRANWFAALQSLNPDDVRVVILGQDPYHGAGEAHGLSFSVPHGIKIPPSLANIYKELARDLGLNPPQHGCLQDWATQGVLLLNSALTVEADKAGSHAKKGWEALTDALIHELAQRHQGLVFMLWGAHAQKKAAKIDRTRHLVLESVHPSPLSAYRGFIGNGHFSAANDYLVSQGRSPIDWQLA